MDKIIEFNKYEELPLFLQNIIEAVVLLEEVNKARADKSKSIIVFRARGGSKEYVLPVNEKDLQLMMDTKMECNNLAKKIRRRLGFYG